VEPLQRIFEPYRHLDPHGWVDVYREVPWPFSLPLVAVGVVMLLFGGRRLFRLLAGPIGALIAMVWAETLATRLGFAGSAKQIALISPFVLLGLGLLFPPIVMFLSFGVPVGLLAGQLAGKADWMLGFAPGFIVGGALGVVMHRTVGAVLSAAAGAWMLMLGLMAALGATLPAVVWLDDNPVVVLSLAGLFALAGIVFQLFVRPTPEEAEKRKTDRAFAKKRAKEDGDMEKRWSKYGKKA
jgi:MFS family permease